MKLGLSWKSVGFAVGSYWNMAVFGMLGLLLVSFLLVYRLGSLTPAFSSGEISARSSASTVQIVRDNPLQLPHKGLQLGLKYLGHHGPVAMRSVSVVFGLGLLISFYYVLSAWYTRRIAVLGGLLLATSSWFLHTARLATPDILFSGVFMLLATGVCLHKARRKWMTAVAGFMIVVGLLYVPGMIWFILPLMVWQRRRLIRLITTLTVLQLVVFGLLAAGLLFPLIAGLVTQSGLYKTWLGAPSDWPTFSEAARNLLNVPVQLFWRGPSDPSIWLGRLPLIDWFGSIMFLIGCYAYRFKLHLDRTWFLIYVFIVSTLLLAVGGPVMLPILLPFVYVVITAGCALMLQQWFTVFPNNPFARGVGVTFLTLAVLSSCFYQLNHYFVAWPHAPETKAVFNQRP